jgi:threonine/homoserine/homoserine lactone efflux protein
MLEILIFAFGIMYSPGPMNMLALFAGVNNQGKQALLFCAGVGFAMLILFLLVGYLGSNIIPPHYQAGIAILGALYISYLGFKIMKSSFASQSVQTNNTQLFFKTGFVLQICNPKALVAIIPIVSIQFPRAAIEGNQIAVWSFILGMMACGAPSLYLLAGHKLKTFALNPKVMAWINRVMAVLLWFVAYQFVAVL